MKVKSIKKSKNKKKKNKAIKKDAEDFPTAIMKDITDDTLT